MSLGLPLVLLIIFGFGISFDLEDAPVLVINQDGGSRSVEIIRLLKATGDFEVDDRFTNAAEAEKAFKSARAMGAVVIPAGYEKDLLSGAGGRVQILIDGSDGTAAGTLTGNLLSSLSSSISGQIADITGQTVEQPVSSVVRPVFNTGMVSAVFLVPGLIALVLSLAGVLMTALTVAREWERGNMEQVFSTPVGRGEIILGKLVPYMVIGLVQALMVLTAGAVIFGVPFQGSVIVLFVGTFLFLAGALGLGLLVSSVTRNQQVATQVGTLVSLLPTVFLSGFMFPIDKMPLFLRAVSHILPARYYVHFLRGVLLKGAGFAELAPDLFAMVVFATIVLVMAVAKFPRRIA
jgi:ABC-2 type transport system permease protein